MIAPWLTFTPAAAPPTTSIYGTADGLTTGDKIDASWPLLPADTQFVPMEGGNHAQMGWYGPQGGDGVARIRREAQHAQLVDATIVLLARPGN